MCSGGLTTDFSGWSQCKRRLDERIAATGAAMKPWTIHDLRRTVVTGMNDIGIAPHVVEAVVNHITGAAKAGVAGVYNRAKYRAREARRAGALGRARRECGRNFVILWQQQVGSIARTNCLNCAYL